MSMLNTRLSIRALNLFSRDPEGGLNHYLDEYAASSPPLSVARPLK